ncbi:MAG: Tfp pilus assembly protein PilF, partial [Moorea sp. SIO4G2]|nr:Tfp pilus assembly protein PilF [Moorena sp. SIO4G2]
LIELAPENAQAHYNLGVALKKRSRVTEALTAVEKALELYQSQRDNEGIEQTESLLKQLQKFL